MSNSKDFYVELRKQVTAIQQSSERAGMCILLQRFASLWGPRHVLGVDLFFVPFKLPHYSNFCSEEEMLKFSIGG